MTGSPPHPGATRRGTRSVETWWWAVLLVTLVLLGWLLVRQAFGDAWTEETVRAAVSDAGPWAPAVYVLAFAAALIVLVPATPFVLAAGFLFGPAMGIVWAWIGSAIGAVAAYEMGRTGSGPVTSLMERRAERLARFLDDHSFATVFMLRVIPVSPFPVLNYALGMAGVRPWEYTWGTLLGIIPFTAVYVLLGAAAGAAGAWRSPGFYVPLAIAVAITAGGVWFARRFHPDMRGLAARG